MNTNPIHITVGQRDNVTILKVVDGRLDNYEQTHALRDELVQAMQDAASKKFVIDMINVTFMTSVALLPFVNVRTKGQQLGGRTVLCNLADIVMQVLTVSQLLVEPDEHAYYLETAADVDTAVQLLNS